MPREWDAKSYDTLPLPHTQWGRRTIDRLDLTGSETVLDAGCGTGRDAELLLARLPQGRVVAVDGSVSMLNQLRNRLAGNLDQLDIIHADLTGQPSLSTLLTGPVDAVMSVAAFHWIPDHDTLFARLAAVMRPGGRISADCGGAGNIAAVRRAIEEVRGAQPMPWNFRDQNETRKSLERAGFDDIDVWLRDDPTHFEQPAQLREYLRTVILGSNLDAMSANEHDDFVDAVARRLPEPVIDYVRLEFTARAGNSGAPVIDAT
jgi:trans-aconitate 2-methyltransferase